MADRHITPLPVFQVDNSGTYSVHMLAEVDLNPVSTVATMTLPYLVFSSHHNTSCVHLPKKQPEAFLLGKLN